MTEILFVNPPTPSPDEHAGYGAMSPPLGIGYVAAALRQAGYSVAAVDLALAPDPVAELRRALNYHQPRIVGFYTLTQNYTLTRKLHGLVRSAIPGVLTWVGGPHTTYQFEEALTVDGYDTAFLFEAEETAVEVAAAQLRNTGDLRDVRGIAFRDGDRIVKTPPRARKKTLDELPFPARDIFPMHLYARPGTVMTSRGCPLKCIFCIASTFEDAYRYRSPENVVAEVREMYERWGVNDFYFIDNVFTTHRARARAICRLLREADLPIGWYCVSRVDYATPSLMQELASAGCYRVELGVESAALAVIETIKKRITIEQVHRAADAILSVGMQPMFTFQVGHPNDTEASIEATLELSDRLRRKGCGTYLSVTTPYPGTPLYEEREQFGLQMHTTDWSEFRMTNPTYSTANFTRNDIRRAIFTEAVRMQEAVHRGLVPDPPLAPWIRFTAGSRVRLPLPPVADDATGGPLAISERPADAPEARVSLPVLQVVR